jgi:hypothetical protein
MVVINKRDEGLGEEEKQRRLEAALRGAHLARQSAMKTE